MNKLVNEASFNVMLRQLNEIISDPARLAKASKLRDRIAAIVNAEQRDFRTQMLALSFLVGEAATRFAADADIDANDDATVKDYYLSYCDGTMRAMSVIAAAAAQTIHINEHKEATNERESSRPPRR